MVRYIDDFVILAHSRAAAMRGWSTAKDLLAKLELEAHDPSLNNEKASMGLVSQGFDFLSYRFSSNGVGLSRSVKSVILEKVDNTIADTKKSISEGFTKQRRAESRLAQSLAHIDSQVRGWGDSFRDIDRRVEFQQLDQQIASRISGLLGWYSRQTKSREPEEKMRALGVALLYDTPAPEAPAE